MEYPVTWRKPLIARIIIYYFRKWNFSELLVKVRSKDQQVKTQLVLWIFVLVKVILNKIDIHNTSCVLTCESLLLTCIHRTQQG